MGREKPSRLSSLLRLFCCVLLAVTATFAKAQVTTYHYDNGRTGATLGETVLNTSNVNSSSFGMLFSLPVDGQIYAQPLYMSGVSMGALGMHNVVYIVTEKNSVYAYDADAPGNPLWHVNLGTPMSASVCCAQRDLYPYIGITSTPVIDPNTNTIYVVAESYENSVTYFRLHALDIATGADKVPAVVIQGSVPGTSSDAVGGVVSFKAIQHWQRPGLLLSKGNIWITFGSHQDTDPYHGWVFTYDAATLARTGIFCVSPNEGESGIWQGGVGATADDDGNVYLETGNGDFNASSGGIDYGDSIIKLSLGANGITLTDYFTPATQDEDNVHDWDLGSSGILLIPGTHLGVAGAKDGKIYVFDTANLSHYHATGDQLHQEWQATYAYSGSEAGGFWGGNYIWYNNTLFGYGERDVLKTFPFNGTTFATTPSAQGTIAPLSAISNDPSISISANGTTPGTAILWATFSASGIANGSAQPGIFYAFDAANPGTMLWSSNQNAARDAMGSWAKWVPPIVVSGKVYLPTFDNTVHVYGLLAPTGSGGTLMGSSTSAVTNANLTTEGNTDWIHWGDGTTNRKTGVTPVISDYSIVGAGPAVAYNNDLRPLSWTDGSPTLTATANTNGVYVNKVNNGFSFTAPADSTQRTLVVHVDGYQTAGTLTAHLSDGSAPDFVDTTPLGTGQFDRNYTLTYSAGTAGQYLTVKWVASSGTGNVAVSAAALSTASINLAASAGTPQTTIVGTAFATALQVLVKDSSNQPLSGATVTFTAPATGASASFSGSATATAVTNASGIATAPKLTANNTTGSYTVLASTSGTTGTASFSLTNAASSGSMTVNAGTPQSATINTAFPDALQVTVKDGANQVVSGASVTFTAPASGASGSFGGSATATVTTNASGVATAPTLTANGVAGSYTVSASTSGVNSPITFSLTNIATSSSGSSLLNGNGDSAATSTSLTTEGVLDWVHWGEASLNRKSGVTAQISTYTVVGTGTVTRYANDPRLLSWTDGTPTAAGSNGDGVYISGTNNGFSFTAPADTTTRTLVIHVGGWNSGGTLTAHVSDGTVTDFVDVTPSTNGQYDRNYKLSYKAGSAAQTLTVKWVMTAGTGNVTLNGAALAQQATLVANSGTPQSAAINATFTNTLQAKVTSGDGKAQSGVSVTFTAPASGASASFNGANAITVVTDANGLATTPQPVANGQTGAYTVTATASGIATTASFSLTNTAASSGSGALSGAGNSNATLSNLTTEGVLDWVHWGDTNLNRKTGVTAQISTYTAVGSGTVTRYNNDPRALSWTDGTPTATGSNGDGVYISGTNNGFSITAPADTTSRILVVHVGGWNSGGKLTAHLSDGSAADFVDTTTTVTGQYDRNYTLTYKAGSATQTLTVKWVMASGTGNVTLNGAGLSNQPLIYANSGTAQSTAVNTTFGNGLQALVTDSNGKVQNGISVTFTAPASGASASFGGKSVVTLVTDANGLATTAQPLANTQSGSYVVTATTAGATTPASYSLTNTAATAGTLTGSSNSATTTFNLTTEGMTDWSHWGEATLIKKSGGTGQIGTYQVVGSGTNTLYTDDLRALSWSDGTPTASATTNHDGVYVAGTGNGYSISVPASTTAHTLVVHVGGWKSGGKLTAHLADGSAADFTDTTPTSTGQYDRTYTLNYTASGTTTLTVTWVMVSGTGNVTLSGAALQ
ncbi:beta strand repeat-containing protein [Silvimonas iriomotensis]|uniref:Big-1 domain-containing protein n=1 Tax=Silvimonas iriomotensis TaxID=449662 RepID=A0ABQ2P5U7_9NEIS|nr:hypothetical protein [Silvimonas iriomotensis]GGP18931.1 hypothetical protein GCM10010970_08100 [Silvimonas iriomotensis]